MNAFVLDTNQQTIKRTLKEANVEESYILYSHYEESLCELSKVIKLSTRFIEESKNET